MHQLLCIFVSVVSVATALVHSTVGLPNPSWPAQRKKAYKLQTPEDAGRKAHKLRSPDRRVLAASGNFSQAARSMAPDTFSQNVYAILCAGESSDPRGKLFTEKLREKGYRVIAARCDDVFNERGIRAKWGLRMKHYKDEIAKLPENAVAVLLDAYDMVVYGTATEAEKKFRRFKVPFVVSCTVAKYPGNVGLCPAQLNIPSPYGPKVPLRNNMHGSRDQCIYPCGGGLMGTKRGLLSLYSDHPFSPDTNDQCWLYEVTSKLVPDRDWALDYKSDLWLEYQSVEDWNSKVEKNAKKERMIVKVGDELREEPTFVHLDGLHPSVDKLRKLYVNIEERGLLLALRASSNQSAA